MLAPPTKDVKEEKEKVEPLQKSGKSVRQLIRGISTTDQFGQDGSYPLPVIEDELNSMLEQGYRLFYTQHLRSNFAPEGNTVMSEQMLYVFVRE